MSRYSPAGRNAAHSELMDKRPSEQKDHDAGHGPQDRNIVEQKGNRSPQHGIAHPAERHYRAGCHAHRQIHDRNRKQVGGYIALDLL